MAGYPGRGVLGWISWDQEAFLRVRLVAVAAFPAFKIRSVILRIESVKRTGYPVYHATMDFPKYPPTILTHSFTDC